jgi:hypothetical protein
MSSYSSPLDGCPVITDANREEFCGELVTVDGHKPCRGRVPRDYKQQPFGSLGFAAPFSQPPIPRSEWADRIRDREKARAIASKVARARGVKTLDQASTNYCWINAPIQALQVCRALAGQPIVELSPASVGAKIKRFQNVGGWGTEGVAYLARVGATPCSLWPANAIDRRYDTPQADAERSKYQVDKWIDLPPRRFDLLMTCLLMGWPVPVGFNWWGHEVLAIDPVILDGTNRFGSRIWNNWGDHWGQQGMAILDEQHATPDDQIALQVVTG